MKKTDSSLRKALKDWAEYKAEPIIGFLVRIKPPEVARRATRKPAVNGGESWRFGNRVSSSRQDRS